MVAVATKEGVEAGKASGGAQDVVGGGGQVIDRFVPGGSAAHEDLDNDGGDTKGLGPGSEGERGPENPEEEGEDECVGVVDDAVEEPSDNIQDGVSETGDDVGNVGTVEDGLEGWKEDDVHGAAEIRRGQNGSCRK